MTFCIQCGTQLPEGSGFCHVCGSAQRQAAVQQPPAQQAVMQPPAQQAVMQQQPMQQAVMQQPAQQPIYRQPVQLQAKKKSKAPLVITIVSLLLMVTAGVLLWLFLLGPFSYTRKITVPGDWEGVAHYTGISGLSDNSDRTVKVYGYFDRDATGAYFQLYEDPQMQEDLLLTMYINDSDLSRFVPDLNKGGAALMDMELDASALPGLTAALDHGELRLKCSYASAAEVSFDCEFVLHQKE
ncbi:MAG: hypothetical protein IJP92_07745 [Lachnospiraceae bacterium]|nr:hypothetical protein [Lachnospiraceae bacterium]